MTSFKKPLIAIAAAVALVTGSFATVAFAIAPATVLTLDGSVITGTTSATSVEVPVPADNSVDVEDAVKIVISNLDAGDSVSATASNAKLVTKLATEDKPVVAGAGSSTLATTANVDGDATLYVFTTTTAKGSVAVKVGENTTTYYLKGVAGDANSVSLDAPVKISADSIKKLLITTRDVFGNLVGDVDVDVTVVADGSSATSDVTTRTATATLGTVEYTLTAPAAGKAIVLATIASYDAADKVDGLTTPVTSVTKSVSVVNFESEYTKLVKKYNKLAKKWNKNFSANKVNLIK